MKTTSLSLILASLFATSFASVNVAAPLSEAEEAFSIPADMPTVLTPNSTEPVKVEKTNKNTPYHAYVHRSKERFASVSTSLYPGKDAKPDVALVLQSGTVTTPASAYLKDSTEPANSDYDNPTSFTKRADIDHSMSPALF